MFSDRLNGYELVLASGSLRRHQLMREAGFRFTTATCGSAESYPPHLRGSEIAMHVAAGKSDACHEPLTPQQILITADTIVLCDGELLGKPGDYDEAVRFLRRLSGREHEVVTAICLRNDTRRVLFPVSTTVTFRQLTEDEIGYYVTNYLPYDKAGAYGIQEWIGMRGITSVRGSYYNVMGLPVSELYLALLQFTENQNNTI